MEILQYDFMLRALAAGLLIGLACSVLGVFLVLRREALIGHGLADVAFGGIALGLLLKVGALPAALAGTVLCALWIVRMRRKGLSDDISIGVAANAGLAVGILIASATGRFTVELFSYLFGNMLAIGAGEVWIAAALALGVLAAVILHFHDLVALAFDYDLARTSGVRTGWLDSLLAVLTAVTVVLAMKVVGILLVSALIVLPAAAVLPFAPTFRRAVAGSMAGGTLSVLGGLVAAYYLDLPAAGAVVLLLVIFFLVPRLLRRLGLFPRLGG